jgi:hypothetical protein
MDTPSEQARESETGQSGKRKYEPPELQSQEVFETTALACRKIFGQGGRCNTTPKTS